MQHGIVQKVSLGQPREHTAKGRRQREGRPPLGRRIQAASLIS